VGAEDFCVKHFCGAVIARPIGTAEGKRRDRCRTSERGKSGSGAINGMPFGTMSIGAIVPGSEPVVSGVDVNRPSGRGMP